MTRGSRPKAAPKVGGEAQPDFNCSRVATAVIAYRRPGRDDVRRYIVLGDPEAIARRLVRVRAVWPTAEVELLDGCAVSR